MYNCKLKIISGITGEKDTLEFYSSGNVSFNNGVTTIEYEDSEKTGLKSKNQVMISSDVVTLNRLGDNASTLVFEKGKSYASEIATPYGVLPLSIFSHKVESAVTDNHAFVNLIYTLDFNGNSTENMITVEADIFN